MAEAIKYAVVCCSGLPIAYIDDNRPIGGPLTVAAAPGDGQIVIGHKTREDSPRPDYEVVARTWANTGVSQTVWEDNGDYADSGRSSWTIRCGCGSCPQQAEMNEHTLVRLADDLAGELDKWPPRPCPDPVEPLQTWVAGEDWAVPVAADADAPTTYHLRRPIPLGVVTRKLTPPNK